MARLLVGNFKGLKGDIGPQGPQGEPGPIGGGVLKETQVR